MFIAAIKRALYRPGSLGWLLAHSQEPAPGLWVPFSNNDDATRYERATITPASHRYNDRVTRIRGGEIRHGTIRSRMPTPDLQPLPGQASPEKLAHTLAFSERTLSRCAPWVAAYLVPRLLCMRATHEASGALVEDKTHNPIGGLATITPYGTPIVLVTTHCSLQSIREILHHEIWHQIENVLSPEAAARLRACLSPYSYTALGAEGYDRCPSERLARAYSHYARQSDDLAEIGPPIPVSQTAGLRWGVGDTRVLYDAFAEVYSGRFADALRAED